MACKGLRHLTFQNLLFYTHLFFFSSKPKPCPTRLPVLMFDMPTNVHTPQTRRCHKYSLNSLLSYLRQDRASADVFVENTVRCLSIPCSLLPGVCMNISRTPVWSIFQTTVIQRCMYVCMCVCVCVSSWH